MCGIAQTRAESETLRQYEQACNQNSQELQSLQVEVDIVKSNNAKLHDHLGSKNNEIRWGKHSIKYSFCMHASLPLHIFYIFNRPSTFSHLSNDI